MTAPIVSERPSDAQVRAPHSQRCLVLTAAGAPVSAGIALLREEGGCDPHRDRRLEARVTGLTAPGALLALHLGQGMRRFMLMLADGRTLPVELVATTWRAPGGRVCYFRA
ncbi:MAG: hypothetical protein C4290_02085 [Chloroflexota bacterium]